MASATDPRPGAPRPHADVVVDASGLVCPMPIVNLARAIRQARLGQLVEVIATDPGILADAPAWAHATGHEIVGQLSEGDSHSFWFRKLHD